LPRGWAGTLSPAQPHPLSARRRQWECAPSDTAIRPRSHRARPGSDRSGGMDGTQLPQRAPAPEAAREGAGERASATPTPSDAGGSPRPGARRAAKAWRIGKRLAMVGWFVWRRLGSPTSWLARMGMLLGGLLLVGLVIYALSKLDLSRVGHALLH